MKRFLPTTLLVSILSLFTLGAAQDELNIAFVDAGAVLAAHPAGAQAQQLEEQARTELGEIQANVAPLLERLNAGEELTAEERSTLDLSQRTYQETQARYREEIQATIQPAEQAVDAIIQEIAQANGYTLVLNQGVAASSALVVYAEEGFPNITQEVIDRVEAGG